MEREVYYKRKMEECSSLDDQEEKIESTESKGGFDKNVKKKDRRNIECFNCHKMGAFCVSMLLK